MAGDDKKSGTPFMRGQAEAIEKITSRTAAAPEKTVQKQEIPQPLKYMSTPFLISDLFTNLPRPAVIPPMTRIGIDAAGGVDVMVSDKERRGGFYVLGQAQTAKSNLLVSMALADIQHGHRILVIDPHTDAINALLARIPESRRKDIMFLDPTHESRSFRINLLHCNDPKDIDKTRGRIRDIFVKLWEHQRGQLGF